MSRAEPWFFDPPIAHRGLHRETDGIIENSLPAFEAAVAGGYGIELDVQPSADGEPIVFHDDRLDRLTEETGPVSVRKAADLVRLRLGGAGGATVPHLSDVLDCVAGRAPLFIEIKSLRRRPGRVEARIAELLARYDGPAAVQSFDPQIVRWFAQEAPAILRGQIATVSYRRSGGDLPWPERWRRAELAYNPLTLPDFVSYDVRALPHPATRQVRRQGIPLLAWTVRDPKAEARAREHADNLVFEGFTPSPGPL